MSSSSNLQHTEIAIDANQLQHIFKYTRFAMKIQMIYLAQCHYHIKKNHGETSQSPKLELLLNTLCLKLSFCSLAKKSKLQNNLGLCLMPDQLLFGLIIHHRSQTFPQHNRLFNVKF